MELSCRPSVVNNRNPDLAEYDPYFQREPEAWETAIIDEIETRLLNNQKARELIKRQIFSRYYHCVNDQNAKKLLQDQPLGSCVFHPSSAGFDRLVMTYKVIL